jgi:hypothetical protein
LASTASGKQRRFPRPFFVIIALPILLVVLIRPAYSEDWSALLDASGLSYQEKESIRLVFKKAKTQSVPEELLTSRLAEGLAKGVSGKNMTGALERELLLLLRAGTILSDAAFHTPGIELKEDIAAWARTANLLSLGISSEDVEKIVHACIHRWNDYRDATYLYVKLIKWGVHRLDALNVTVAVAGSSVPGKQISGVFDLFTKARRRRISPETLTSRIIDHLPDIRDVRELEREILNE